jgi:uncharacterized membrane protein
VPPSGPARSLPPVPERVSPLPADVTGRYTRSSLEFDRFAFFSDAVYAIAMTLLVVGIAVPAMNDSGDSGEMLDLLVGLRQEFVSFFVGFAVLGRYWLAHHRFVALLAGVNARLMVVNLAYLSIVAFLPFPTALVGRYEENVVAFAFYALVLGIVSGLETLLAGVALRDGLLTFTMPASVARYGFAASMLPVAVFVLSIPLALLAGSTVALLSWLLIWPLEAVLDRLRPAEARAAS